MPLGGNKDHKVAIEVQKFAEKITAKHLKEEKEKQRNFLLQVKKHPMPIVIGKRQSIVSFDKKTEEFVLTTESENFQLKDDATFWKMIEENKDLSKAK